MSQEILYTSAPQGLKQGSRGFCTVISTSGMAANLAERLEALSGYRHAFEAHDANVGLNPVNYFHAGLSVGGRKYHVLGAVRDAGLDYTHRTNKLAHLVALEAGERVEGGPAWALADPQFCETAWDGQTRILSAGRRPRHGERPPGVCRGWQSLTGDAGWAGALAEMSLERGNRPVSVIYRAGTDVLALVVESLSLVAPERRWDVTFSTYFTKLPAGVECLWRFVLDESDEARALRRNPHALLIDLCQPLSRADGGALVEAARNGTVPRARAPAAVHEPRKAASSSSADWDDDDPVIELDYAGEIAASSRAARSAPPTYAVSSAQQQPSARPVAASVSPRPQVRLGAGRRHGSPALWALAGFLLFMAGMAVGGLSVHVIHERAAVQADQPGPSAHEQKSIDQNTAKTYAGKTDSDDKKREEPLNDRGVPSGVSPSSQVPTDHAAKQNEPTPGVSNVPTDNQVTTQLRGTGVSGDIVISKRPLDNFRNEDKTIPKNLELPANDKEQKLGSIELSAGSEYELDLKIFDVGERFDLRPDEHHKGQWNVVLDGVMATPVGTFILHKDPLMGDSLSFVWKTPPDVEHRDVALLRYGILQVKLKQGAKTENETTDKVACPLSKPKDVEFERTSPPQPFHGVVVSGTLELDKKRVNDGFLPSNNHWRLRITLKSGPGIAVKQLPKPLELGQSRQASLGHGVESPIMLEFEFQEQDAVIMVKYKRPGEHPARDPSQKKDAKHQKNETPKITIGPDNANAEMMRSVQAELELYVDVTLSDQPKTPVPVVILHASTELRLEPESPPGATISKGAR